MLWWGCPTLAHSVAHAPDQPVPVFSAVALWAEIALPQHYNITFFHTTVVATCDKCCLFKRRCLRTKVSIAMLQRARGDELGPYPAEVTAIKRTRYR